MTRYKLLFFVLIISSLLTPFLLFSGCNEADNRSLFQRFGNGIDTISAEGLSDVWNMTGNISSSNVTVVESFYNYDSIWVGLRIEGEELISHAAYSLFYYNGEMIGAGGHGGSLEVDTENWIEETIRQPSSWADVSALPDEFILELVVGDMKYQERTTTFEIPLKRSDRKVIRP
jgi:hypothetical protein